MTDRIELYVDGFEGSIEVYCSDHWSSVNKDFRINIRRHIKEKLTPDFKSDILDLKQLPHHGSQLISISHCKSAGGYALAEKCRGLGFDLEVAQRVRKETVQRISQSHELKTVSECSHLWCIKEACYKALGHELQKTIKYSSIVVAKWNQDPAQDHYFFAAHCEDVQFKGLSFQWRALPAVSAAIAVRI